jgi:hypothetical protein
MSPGCISLRQATSKVDFHEVLLWRSAQGRAARLFCNSVRNIWRGFAVEAVRMRLPICAESRQIGLLDRLLSRAARLI